jgi:AcrR family transcriptional regulator
MAKPERKFQLVEATQRAISEHGVSVKLHQIAEEAGMTPSAVLYHYPDVNDLLLAANRAGMERFYSERVKSIESLSSPAEKLIRVIRSGLPTDNYDEGVRLLCALGGEAARNDMFAVLLTSLFDRQVGLYQSILEAGSLSGEFELQSDANTIARNLVALEDAYGYRIMACHPTLDYEEACELILDYARSMTKNSLRTLKGSL